MRESFQGIREMAPRDVAVIKALELLADQGEEFADAFYARLFRRCPDIGALFLDADMGNQHLMLTSALVFTLESLGEPNGIHARMRHLGRVHRHAGVKREHFGPFNDCLRETLRETAGDDWTQEMASLWDRALEMVTAHMIAGLQENGGSETP